MTEQELEGLRAQTVDVIDHVARLAIKAGCSPMKLWGQVQDRVVAAARSCETTEEWASKLLRTMRVQTPDAAASEAITSLVAAIGQDHRVRDRWFSMVEQEASYLMARLRQRREKKKAAYESDRAEQEAIAGAAAADRAKPKKARKKVDEKVDEKPGTPAGQGGFGWSE